MREGWRESDGYYAPLIYTHVQDGSQTALWIACNVEQEAAAAELMEATKLAGALDAVESVCGVRSTVRGAGKEWGRGRTAEPERDRGGWSKGGGSGGYSGH